MEKTLLLGKEMGLSVDGNEETIIDKLVELEKRDISDKIDRGLVIVWGGCEEKYS